MLTNPVYAGAYAYGKTRHERYVDEQGVVRKRVRRLPEPNGRCSFPTIIRATSIGRPTRPTKPASLATPDRSRTRPAAPCEKAQRCSRASPPVAIAAGGCAPTIAARNATPGYHCAGKHIVEGRGVYCLNVGGVQIDQAVVQAILAAVTPAGVEAAAAAAEQLEADDDAALGQWRREVERRALRERSGPNGAIAPSIPRTAWSPAASKPNGSRRCATLHQAEAELARREQQRRQQHACRSRRPRGPRR